MANFQLLERKGVPLGKKKESAEKDDERRKGDDRRNLSRSVSFPYKTREGLVILKDRRKTPDRRLNNIEVGESPIDEEEFFEFLKDYNKYI